MTTPREKTLRRSERLRLKNRRNLANTQRNISKSRPVTTSRRKKATRRKSKPKFNVEKKYNRRKHCYSVARRKNTKRGTKRKVYAYCTTKEKANKQMRLLYALTYNKDFRKSLTKK
tara:strand:+ start:1540 stop:1887 length:348 start_codon:yes stop_codon:yes gene_type:complete